MRGLVLIGTFLAVELGENTVSDIRLASHYCQPLGDKFFKLQIEKKLARPLGYARRGRPKKVES